MHSDQRTRVCKFYDKSVFQLVVVAAFALLFSACSMFQKGTKSVYHSAAFDDHNRAPGSLAPQDVSDPSRIDPLYMQTQADYHFTLGETYSLAGESQKAVEEFRLTLIYDPKSAAVRSRLAKEYLRLGMVSEAMEQSELAIELDPKGTDQRLLLGKLYTGLKMFDQALEQYRQVLEEDVNNSDAELFVGAILAEQEKYQEAVDHLQALTKVKNFERMDLVHFYLGRVIEQWDQKGAKKRARQSYEKSLRFNPEFEDALLAIVRTYLAENQQSEAMALLRSYQMKHGPSETVAEVLVDFYLEEEKYEDAFAQFEILEERNPKDISIKHKMALILMEKKEYQKAADYLQKILAQEPQLDKIRFYLAAVYEESGAREKAVVHFLRVSPGSQYYGDSVVHAAHLYKQLGENEKATETLRTAISRRSDVPEFYAMYASMLDDSKQYAEAVVMLEESLDVFPNDAQLLFYLGSMYDKVNRVDKTIETMKKVLSVDQNHVQALNYLAYTYAEENIELDVAETLVRRALELTPNDGFIMDTLGWVLYKKGKFKGAVAVLEEAFRLKSTESIIAEHLGDAYYKYQLPNKAREMYVKAVAVGTENSNIQKLRNKIVSIDSQVDRARRMPASSGKQKNSEKN